MNYYENLLIIKKMAKCVWEKSIMVRKPKKWDGKWGLSKRAEFKKNVGPSIYQLTPEGGGEGLRTGVGIKI